MSSFIFCVSTNVDVALAKQAPRVTFVLDPDFDLDNTIFKSLDSQLNRVIMKAKLGNQVLFKLDLMLGSF